MSNFTPACFNATCPPFELVNDSVNVNYMGGVKGIIWDIQSAIFIELQGPNRDSFVPGVGFPELRKVFELAQRNRNKEGRVSFNRSYFDGKGRKAIAPRDRQAIEACFKVGGRLYISVAETGSSHGLPLYVDFRCD